MEKREMTYGDADAYSMKGVILESGTYMGLLYAAVNMGGWPCGYVEVTGTRYDGNSGSTDAWRDFTGEVHGGITYNEGEIPPSLRDTVPAGRRRWFIGWDYAHAGDYIAYGQIPGAPIAIPGRKWTTDEIVGECKAVIRKLTNGENLEISRPDEGVRGIIRICSR